MPRRRLPPPLSDGQQEVMNVVWTHGEVTVTDVWQELAGARKIARNTVQTIMLRLEEKGWLKHAKDGKMHVYSAVHPREASRRQLAQRLLEGVFGGSIDGLVSTLLSERGVSDEEVARIRALIRQADPGSSDR